MHLQQWITLIVRIAVGTVFLYSGIAKLMNVGAFIDTVRQFQLVPEFSLPFFSLALPMVEVLLGILLIIGLWTQAAAFVVSLLLLGFTVVLTNALLTGTAKECGCFGADEALDWSAVGRDIILLALSFYLMQTKDLLYSLDHWRRLQHAES